MTVNEFKDEGYIQVAVVVLIFNPSIRWGRDRKISEFSARLTERVPGQPGLYKETLSGLTGGKNQPSNNKPRGQMASKLYSAEIKDLPSDLVNQMLKHNSLQRHMPEKAGRFPLRKVLAGQVFEPTMYFQTGC